MTSILAKPIRCQFSTYFVLLSYALHTHATVAHKLNQIACSYVTQLPEKREKPSSNCSSSTAYRDLSSIRSIPRRNDVISRTMLSGAPFEYISDPSLCDIDHISAADPSCSASHESTSETARTAISQIFLFLTLHNKTGTDLCNKMVYNFNTNGDYFAKRF